MVSHIRYVELYIEQGFGGSTGEEIKGNFQLILKSSLKHPQLEKSIHGAEEGTPLCLSL